MSEYKQVWCHACGAVVSTYTQALCGCKPEKHHVQASRQPDPPVLVSVGAGTDDRRASVVGKGSEGADR